MDRPTAGRRHLRAGSVRVTDLINARRRLDIAKAFSDDPDAASGPDTDPVPPVDRPPPTPHRRPTLTLAQLARIACLGVAALVLCASLAIGSVIARHRQGEPAGVAQPDLHISGEQALLPDQLNLAVPGYGRTAAPGLTGRTRASGMIDNQGPGPVPPAEPPPSVNPSVNPGTTTVDSGPDSTALVEQFYRLVQSEPDRAYSLLDATLFGTDLGEFIQSWSSVTEVHVMDVRAHGSGVLANVRMRLPDGTHLRVQQLLEVTSTLPQRIIGAKILSAQRS